MQRLDDLAATVTVRPKNITFSIEPGQSVYDAAVQNGIRWPTSCEGLGTCHLCFMSVIEGADRINAVEPFEADGLAEVVDTSREGTLRLACQVRPEGDIIVMKRGVRKVPGRPHPNSGPAARRQSDPTSGAKDE
ncbi:2Fe-2S iron-sulfur cluster-binding protein [Parafrankia sp. EUN1f]|uniref:2Fe-2S iron-sulfur cluster-binding protein n=1 Tax=Parafrankia sp. EUN1f TaxID=102897 RepID=UPI0001C47797|nr:2Fe-2S iron-sulfur cluster-binding protein [Parafrankia sp. EUN1f]EFC86818.1 ferredoxin [Parafrankia sp. EUN1f]